jgi:hypothetical protein
MSPSAPVTIASQPMRLLGRLHLRVVPLRREIGAGL